jgi:hypothetical protein
MRKEKTVLEAHFSSPNLMLPPSLSLSLSLPLRSSVLQSLSPSRPRSLSIHLVLADSPWNELQWHDLSPSSTMFSSVADTNVMRTPLRPPGHLVEYRVVLLRTDRISAECALCARDDFDGYALLDGLYASSPA